MGGGLPEEKKKKKKHLRYPQRKRDSLKNQVIISTRRCENCSEKIENMEVLFMMDIEGPRGKVLGDGEG